MVTLAALSLALNLLLTGDFIWIVKRLLAGVHRVNVSDLPDEVVRA